MKVCIYARVSTDDKGQDPLLQVNACKEYCERNRHEVVAILIDEGVTGNSWYYDRPKGKELKKLIDRGSVKGIVCFATLCSVLFCFLHSCINFSSMLF